MLEMSYSNQNSRNATTSPILVTGAHRSGTTWIGKMLAASQNVAYISEPLNLWHRPGVMSAPVDHWYTYICPENETAFLPALQDTLAYRYHIWAEIRSIRSVKDFLRMGRDFNSFTQGKVRSQVPLLKDPFAVFSAPWFSDRLGCRVIIAVRHPAAFASSLKRLGWAFDFKHLLQQPLLMAERLEQYREAMTDMLNRPDDVIGQSALLWCMVYGTVKQISLEYPNFLLLRHEELSLSPAEKFSELYAALGLDFTPHSRDEVIKSTSGENPRELSKNKMHAVRLDSRKNVHNWKKRLNQDQIERLYELTNDVACHFYSDEEWL